MALHILNIIKLRGQWVVHINDNDLPVGLLLVKKSHNTQNLDLLDLTGVSDGLANLANVERVVVTLGLSLWVDGGRVFPSLGEGTVVPKVTLVREAVADKPDLSLLYILLDGVEKLFLRDLRGVLVFVNLARFVGCKPQAFHWSSEESRQSC